MHGTKMYNFFIYTITHKNAVHYNIDGIAGSPISI